MRDLPTGWGRTRLKDTADQRREKTVPTPDDTRPYVALEHLEQGSPTLLGYSTAGEATSTKTVFRKGDVLFGKLRPNLRKAAPAPFDGVCSTDILALYGRNSLTTEYLACLCQWSPLQQHAVSTASGTKMPRTSWQLLGKFEFPIPPLPEQRKIAAILSSVDGTIEKTQAVIDQVQVVKKGLMQELLTRGLPGRHKKFKTTEIGKVPEEWDVVELRDVGDERRPVLRTGPFGSSLKTEHFRAKGVPVLNIQCLGEGQIVDSGLFYVDTDKANELSGYQVEEGDLVFSRVADVGRSVVIPRYAAGWIISSNLMRISPNREKVDPRFLMYTIVGSESVTDQIAAMTSSGGRQVVSSSILKRLMFPLPSVEEQSHISNMIEGTERRIEAERTAVSALNKLKQALMSALLTGEVRVTPDPEPS